MTHSKKLQFSILNNQDTVKVSEFEVTHRDLYTAADRLPVKNGVLDRRLVRDILSTVDFLIDRLATRERRRRARSARLVVCLPSTALATTRTSSSLSPFFTLGTSSTLLVYCNLFARFVGELFSSCIVLTLDPSPALVFYWRNLTAART